jgi:hypothetical protein
MAARLTYCASIGIWLVGVLQILYTTYLAEYETRSVQWANKETVMGNYLDVLQAILSNTFHFGWCVGMHILKGALSQGPSKIQI